MFRALTVPGRQHRQDGISRLHLYKVGEPPDLAQQVPLRQDDPLGQARGAAGVRDGGGGVEGEGGGGAGGAELGGGGGPAPLEDLGVGDEGDAAQGLRGDEGEKRAENKKSYLDMCKYKVL